MENLLKSKLRRKLLAFFFHQPEKEAYIREIAREIKEDPANLSRELKKMEVEGLFTSFFRGKQRYFKLDKNFFLYNEYRKIIYKTVGIEKKLADLVKSIKNIKIAFIYGSVASNKEKAGSDIDVFLIGQKVNTDELLPKINRLEKEIHREINYRLFTEDEFTKAVKKKKSFILNILKNKKIFITGDEKYLRKFN